jgi:VWFA-related protein
MATLLLVAAASAPAARQAPPSAAGVPLRIVVTDARGKHVPGLLPADVEVSEGSRSYAVHSLAAAPRGGRTIGILLDEYHVAAGPAVERAVASLLAFVDNQLRSDDTVFVMRPLDPASSIAAVRDRTQLRDAISRFEGRKENFAPRNDFEAEYLSAAPPMATRQRAQMARAAIQALATAMGKADRNRTFDAATAQGASRAMIIVTEGFAPDDRGRERLATLRTVGRTASLANVAIYVMDPSPAPKELSPLNDAWQALAAQTGGVLTRAGASLGPALAQVSADLDDSYQLTIEPPEKEDGAFHRLDVKLKRKDVAVRAPTGFWAPIAAERMMIATRPAMSTYLKTPHVSGLIQPWFRMTRGSEGQTRVTFSWGAKARRSRDASTLTFSAVNFEGVKLATADVSRQDRSDESARTVFDTVPGPIQVSMEIRDAGGKVLDTEVRYIDVPALETSNAKIAAVEVLRTRTLREFTERQLDPDVMPADTTEFDRQDRLIVRVSAYSQRGETPPLVRARLLNPLGQPLRELTPLPVLDGIAQFDLPLASYARGDYRIEIRATSGRTSAEQLVMFRLIG